MLSFIGTNELFDFLENDAQAGGERKMKGVPMKKRKTYNPWGVKAMAVTSDDYARKREDEIPADEQYLYRYDFDFYIIGF